MRERRRERPPEPPEPTKAPPPAPKPKPLPRGPPSVEDDLSDKGKADSINDSFEDIPDRRSKIERIHGVPTPLSAVLQKSMEKSDHEDHDDHEEDSNSHGPPGYSTDDPERREVGTRQDILHTNHSMPDIVTIHQSLPDNTALSTPDIDHTNQSMYVFSYPSSIDSNMSDICGGDYDASKPFRTHRQRASSGSDIATKSRIKSDKLYNSFASIPQANTSRQYEKLNRSGERIYAEVEGSKRGKNKSRTKIDMPVEESAVTQPKIYGRRSKHFIKNQKQAKLSQKAPISQPSLEKVAISSLIPDKGQNTKPHPLYAKINKDSSLYHKENKLEDRKQSDIDYKSSNTMSCKDDQSLETEDSCPETTRDRIREELKMYILTPQAKETVDIEQKSEELYHENLQIAKDIPLSESNDMSKVSNGAKESDSNFAERKHVSKVSLTIDKSERDADPMTNNANLQVELSDQENAKQSSPQQTNIAFDGNTDKDITVTGDLAEVLPLLKRRQTKPNTDQAIRDWVNNIDTSFEVEMAENKPNADDFVGSYQMECNDNAKNINVVSGTHSQSADIDAVKNDVPNDYPLPLSPAIVVSDCDREQKPGPVINPYQIVFDSSIKVSLNKDGQDIDFDAQLEKFSNLSSGSSDMDLHVTDTLRVDNDEKLERFSTVSTESSDLELKYGNKGNKDNDVSLEKFCSLSTDSSDGDLRVSNACSRGPHLTIPTKVLRKKHKKKENQPEIRSNKDEMKKSVESSDSSNGMDIDLTGMTENEGHSGIEMNSKDLNETELHHNIINEHTLDKTEIQLGVRQQDSLTKYMNDGSVKPKQRFDSIHLPSHKISDQSVSEQKLIRSTADKEEEKSDIPQTLKKMKSKEKLGSSFSCMAARTTSPFEEHEQSKHESQMEGVKTGKPRSVYQLVATQLSKPFSKRKSKDNLQNEEVSVITERKQGYSKSSASAIRKQGYSEASCSAITKQAYSEASGSANRRAPQNEIDKTVVIGSQTRTRFNKPDWFKTYLLPDDQNSNSIPKIDGASALDPDSKTTNANQDKKQLSTKSETVTGITFEELSGNSKNGNKHKVDIGKGNSSYGLAKENIKHSKSNSSDPKIDLKAQKAKVSKQKVSPGVIHMLNPCPSGWIEGGLEVKLNTEKAVGSNVKMGSISDHGQGPKSKDSERIMQVSALNFDLTKGSPKLDTANELDVLNAGNNGDSKERAGKEYPGMSHAQQVHAWDEVSEPAQSTDVTGLKTEPCPDLSKSRPVDIGKIELVEDKLCQRKWKYMPLKRFHKDTSDTSEFGKKHANDLTSKTDEIGQKNTDPTTCKDKSLNQEAIVENVTHNNQSMKGSSIVNDLNKYTKNKFSNNQLQEKVMKTDKSDSSHPSLLSQYPTKEGYIDRTERKIIVDNEVFSFRPKEKQLGELSDNKSVVSGIEAEFRSEQLLDHGKDPLDDGSIPYADEEVVDIVLQEDEAKNIISEANSNTNAEVKVNNLSEERSIAKDVKVKRKISEENTNTKEEAVNKVFEEKSKADDTVVNDNIRKENVIAKDGTLNYKIFEQNTKDNKSPKNPESPNANESQESVVESRCPELAIDRILCECNVEPDKRLTKTGTILTISSKQSKQFLTDGKPIGPHSEHGEPTWPHSQHGEPTGPHSQHGKSKAVILSDRISDIDKSEAKFNANYSDETVSNTIKKVNPDQLCNDDAGNTIMCECNFKSVPVTDLDGSSWYENNDEIETVCSYTDEKVPVIVDDSPYVPKKKILKSSYSADNLTRGSNKKGVRFHSNLPTWKKISWRSESNLRRMKAIYRDEEDMDKQKYIENFIMCMFDQEPRNMSLSGNEDSENRSFRKQESESCFNKTESQLETMETKKQKPSLPLFDFDRADDQGESCKLRESKPRGSEEYMSSEVGNVCKSKTNFENDSFQIDSRPTLHVTAKIDSLSPDLTGELKTEETVNDKNTLDGEINSATSIKQPPVVAKQPNDENTLDDENNFALSVKQPPVITKRPNNENTLDGEINSATSFKQPPVIAKQPKPYGPKFFVPVSHSGPQGACGFDPSFAQVGTSNREKFELFKLPVSRGGSSTGSQSSCEDQVNPLGDYDLDDPDTSKITIIDATTCDVKRSEIRTKPLTDWRTYLKSYEEFRKKMDASVDSKDSERIDWEYDSDKFSQNVKDYADVSLISLKTSQLEDNSPVSSTENCQAAVGMHSDWPLNECEQWLDSGDREFMKAETDISDAGADSSDTLCVRDGKGELQQHDKNFGSEYDIDMNIAHANTDTDHRGDGSGEGEFDELPKCEVVTDRVSPFPGKTTRYVFTVPDETDPESPRIKSVTYEYITEYKLNKVKVDYQHSKKVQTETDALPSTEL